MKLKVLNSRSEAEVWKDIVPFEGLYQIANFGRLKSFKSNPNGRILSNVNNKGGYYSIVLCHKDLVKYTRIHILVAEYFIGKRPSEKHQVHHKDDNKQNNYWRNLE